jgi:hypothetical protein
MNRLPSLAIPVSLSLKLPLLLTLMLFAPLVLPMKPTPFGFSSWTLVQARQFDTISRGAWHVALPATATVRIKQGGSISGRLVAFTSIALTLAVAQQSQTVVLDRVNMIEFAEPNDLWVTLPKGRRQQVRPIRGGISLPIDALPRTAIRVDPASNTAIVDLSTVLSKEQFAKLIHDPKVVYVLKRLEVAADGSISLRVKGFWLQ